MLKDQHAACDWRSAGALQQNCLSPNAGGKLAGARVVQPTLIGGAASKKRREFPPPTQYGTRLLQWLAQTEPG